ncbi:hypothetical protein [Breoghania sp. JC706]|uniref:hypothetical protein n=1 Tax=Breoghania sp. JC706 TaxID=3117732 RepID=UPI00300B78E0
MAKFIEFSSPPLVKYCPSAYNIKTGCNTIRLGTLFSYRKEENEKLRDIGEGKFKFSIQFPKLSPVSNDWVSEFEFGGHEDGTGYAAIEEMAIISGQAHIKGVEIYGSTHNCWIYCLSLSENSSAGSITETHDSFWEINAKNLGAFAGHLSNLLWSSISVKDIPDYLLIENGFNELASGLQLEVDIQPVSYEERSICIEQEADFPISEVRHLKNKIAFIKPENFRDEKELRIAFWLKFREKRISIKDNPKILLLRPVDKLLSAENYL